MKLNGRFLVIVILLLLALALPAFSQNSDDDEPSIITILHALKTTYIQDEETDTDSIRFEGDVQVSVEKGSSKTTIFASAIDFDRKRNTLYAEGSVTMEQETNGEVTERLTADSLLFDTKKLEGFFNQGRVVQVQQESLNLSGDSVLIVSSELFAKGSSNTVTFKNGNLTFCDDEHPHWEINASRIWLLPGNEFAFANALLFIGPVPVMYFPFFYYPKDELVFNPAFGFRSREGFFVQTTTYIIGRKPLTTESSEDSDDIGFNFMQQSELKEQELQGLVLRNLDESATMPTDYLKILGDYYTTLGGMVGVQGYFEPNNVISTIGFDTRLGFSNVVFKVDDFPLSISYEKDEKHADYGWFFGTKLPFRYAVGFNTDISLDTINISMDIPLYSDPWFEEDFSDRQESMDWIDFFLSGALTTPPEEEEEDDSNGITGFTWDVTASYNPEIPSLDPWLTRLSITTLNSSIVFGTQNAPSTDFEDAQIYANSPNRKFFYPSQVKPLSAKINIEGTLVDWSNTVEASTIDLYEENTNLTSEQEEIVDMMLAPEGLNKIKTDDSSEDEIEDAFTLDVDTLPNVDVQQSDVVNTETSSYTLEYEIIPEVSSLYTYSSTKPSSNDPISPSTFNLEDPKSGQVFFNSDVILNSQLNLFSSYVSINNSLSFLPEYEKHHTLSNSYYTDSEKDSIQLDDYKSQKLDMKNTNTVSVKPFTKIEMFEKSSVNWNTSLNIIDTEFIGDIDKPKWQYNTTEWDSESITRHNLNATFEANQDTYYQRLSLQTNLPPLVDLYTTSLALGFPIGSVTGSTGYKKESATSDNWLFQPFLQSSSWTFFKTNKEGESNKHAISLKQSYEYNIEDNNSEELSVSLGWQGLQLVYDMRYGYDYDLDQAIGWVASDEKTFSPYAFSLVWNINNFEIKATDDSVNIKPGLSTALSWDMVIPTRSYFSFKPSLLLEVKDFLKITFAAESRNEQIARYMQDAIGFAYEIPGEKNVFIDLFNSFAFNDEEKRESSGFKIESLSLTVEHDLHDWVLSSEFEIEPRIITETNGSKSFDYSPYFTLSILWKPMAGIKTTIEDDYGEFTLNP